jgi:hypothetical protein
MKKVLLLFALGIFLLIAYRTKPDDKTCIEAAVKVVWRNQAPDKNKFPGYYSQFIQFMNIISPNVIVDDWVFLKRIRYKLAKREITVGIGMFRQVIVND